jgi:hypothetical protein
MKKRGQITIFIIIAIVLVVGVILFFIFRSPSTKSELPATIEPVYNSFLSCLEDYTSVGINVLGSQGGYIETPDFEPGSYYMPFSSHLDFMGSAVPYWYYVSRNNIPKEQVPTKKIMEEQLEDFIEQKIRGCVFEDYKKQGFEILLEDNVNARVSITDEDVRVDLKMGLEIERGEDRALVSNHGLIVKSKLGTLYNSALKIYEYEQNNLFLEEYGVDVLRLYAPVDGVELTCSPVSWNADQIFNNLSEALEANIQALKVKGGEYSLRNKEDKYFVLDLNVDSNVRFLNSKNWTNSFSVTPSENGILLAKPVGNSPGMGIMGFCYVPYHFVYDVKYPVLVQLFEGEEFFQFPLAVVISGNLPRNSADSTPFILPEVEICGYENSVNEVRVYDSKSRPISDAKVYYQCSAERCEIGKTNSAGILNADFPQCVNGFVSVSAEGYSDAKEIHSTVSPGSLDIFMDRIYELDLELDLDGRGFSNQAVVSFTRDDYSSTIVYPEQRKVSLVEGQYEIRVYIYQNSSIKIPSSSTRQCVDVPSTGLSSLFGGTKKECFDYEMPEQIISNSLSGGGKQNYYILESELEGNSVVTISAQSLKKPSSLEELQNNYLVFEERRLGVSFS